MKRALISVYDKTGIVEFSKSLVLLGWEIISTGGSYNTLKEAGIKTPQSELVVHDYGKHKKGEPLAEYFKELKEQFKNL